MTLDELLLEWSYRSERGYPSVDNPSDISTLKQILKELNLPEGDIDEFHYDEGKIFYDGEQLIDIDNNYSFEEWDWILFIDGNEVKLSEEPYLFL